MKTHMIESMNNSSITAQSNPMLQSDRYQESSYIKTYMFIKGYAMGRNLPQTLTALSLARDLHEGQFRRDGSAVISHPLKVCSVLINYGVCDDVVLAAALLHDTLEDCTEKLPQGGQELVTEYHLSSDVLDLIRLLTKQSGLNDEELTAYFSRIQNNPKAALIKLADRMHNSSTLYTFTNAKMRKYIRETDLWLIPMASFCKRYYLEYAAAFNGLKNCIESMNKSMGIMLERIEVLEKQLEIVSIQGYMEVQ